MKNYLLLCLSSLFFISCAKLETYNCTCRYNTRRYLPANYDTAAKVETFVVKGRGYEKASSNCQVDYANKYRPDYYEKGICIIK